MTKRTVDLVVAVTHVIHAAKGDPALLPQALSALQNVLQVSPVKPDEWRLERQRCLDAVSRAGGNMSPAEAIRQLSPFRRVRRPGTASFSTD